MVRPSILILENDPNLSNILFLILSDYYECAAPPSHNIAYTISRNHDLVILNHSIFDNPSALLKQVRDVNPLTKTLVLTTSRITQRLVKSLEVDHVMEKPFEITELLSVISNLVKSNTYN